MWSERLGGLFWVDMLAGDVLSLSEDGSVSRRHVGRIAAALRPRRQGGAVVAVGRGFVLEDAHGAIHPLKPLWSGTRFRMNEGACDPHGRFYCGSMAYNREVGAGSLYRLDPDGSAVKVLSGVTISNGIDWSPDGSLVYYIDTETYRIDEFSYDKELRVDTRRTFASIDRDDGRPDGLTVDSAGGVWVALNGGGTVRRYNPEGVVDCVVEVPVSKVTSCTFGGRSLRQLFITTSREGLSSSEQPDAGSLFAVQTDVTGLPTREFVG